LGSKTPGVNVDGVASSTGPATIWLDGSGNPIVSGSGGYVTTIGDNSVFLGSGQDQAITSYFESGAGEYYNPLNDSVIDYTAGGIDYPVYDDFAALGVDF
jgi:hypothetical protein